jgi:NADP-dependent 3-hydroxy acid dehydrogenase YdfG
MAFFKVAHSLSIQEILRQQTHLSEDSIQVHSTTSTTLLSTAIIIKMPRNTNTGQLVWLITGCSSGFGEEFINHILARGDCVIATARDLSKIGNLSAMAQAQHDVFVRQLDVTASQESLNETNADAIKIYGRIDVLVNNAGYVTLGGWEDLGYDGFVKQFETNVFGLLKVTNAVLPHMRGRRSGTLVFKSSLSGWKGDGFCGAYGGSKFAVEGLLFPSSQRPSLALAASVI